METHRRSLIYVSGPLTTGSNVLQNVRRALDVGTELWTLGYAVIVPHEHVLTEIVSPAPYEQWMEYDKRALLQCDAMLRMDGASHGADEEERFAFENKIPVYYQLTQLHCAISVTRKR